MTTSCQCEKKHKQVMVKLSPLVEQQVLLPFVSLITACVDRCALLADLGSSCLSDPALFSWVILDSQFYLHGPTSSHLYLSTACLRVSFSPTVFTCNLNSCPCSVFFTFLFFKPEILLPFQTCNGGSSASYHSHPFLITVLISLYAFQEKKLWGKKSYISFVVRH